jgi:signal-transduction protein with cAMP-binding, CBS, and nucleotidyltransferase domain
VIVNQELIKMVSSNTLFKGVSKNFIKSFIKPKNYYGIKEGTIIYSKDDDSTDLYLIVEGEVKIKFCDKNKVEHKYITDFFGEDEILKKDKRSSHAVANNDCILYTINTGELENLTQHNRGIANNLTKKNNEKPDSYSHTFESEILSRKIDINNETTEIDASSNESLNGEENIDDLSEDSLNQNSGEQKSKEGLAN